MILTALALLGFGVTDLMRGPPERVDGRRAALAASGGVAAVVALAAASGMRCSGVLIAGLCALTALSLWSASDLVPWSRSRPEIALALVGGVIAATLAISGLASPVGGDLATWYGNLGFGFVAEVPVGQFVLAAAATVFLLATANRVVRLTLLSTMTSFSEGEGTLRGGRLLGPMERLIVVAAIISGDLAGAGFVIAAKGLLRFREIGGSSQTKVDEITEYFLIGTFTSVILAAVAGLLVLAAA